MRLNEINSSPKNSSFLRMDRAGLYHWRAEEGGERNSIKEASSNVFHSKVMMMIIMFPDLQDSWCVEQVCDELGQNLAAEGQSEQESAPSLSRDQLLASFGLLHGQGQGRQPANQQKQQAIKHRWHVTFAVFCINDACCINTQKCSNRAMWNLY